MIIKILAVIGGLTAVVFVVSNIAFFYLMNIMTHVPEGEEQTPLRFLKMCLEFYGIMFKVIFGKQEKPTKFDLL